MMKLTLLTFCFFIILCRSAAQHLPVTVYSSREGAPVVGANSVFQDSNGWMWFTTGYEVVRYDAHRFKTFQPVQGVRVEFVHRIIEINKELWVLGTPGPLKVVGDSLVPLEKKSASLYLINALLHDGIQYVLERHGLYQLKNNELNPFITDSTLDFGSASNIIVYNDSILLCNIYETGLVVFNTHKRNYRLLHMPVFDMRKDRSGNVFLFLNKGIYRLLDLDRPGGNQKAETELYFPLEIKPAKLEHFLVDTEGNIWCFEQFSRLIKITPQKKMINYNMVHGLPSLWFNQALIDRENNLWIAMNGGICKINYTAWERFTTNEGLSFNHPLFIIYSQQKRFYIGAENGLNVFTKNELQLVKGKDANFHCSFLVEQNSHLFFLRGNEFYSVNIDTVTNRVSDERLLARLPSQGIELAIDNRGTVFIATTTGLFAWQENRLTNMLAGKKTYFRRLLVDSRGDLWAGDFGGGIFQFEISYREKTPVLAEKNFVGPTASRMPLRLVRAIAEDNNGNILVGTRFNGLFYLEMNGDELKSVHHFSEENGLASNSVWGLAADRHSAWIGTAKGLNRLVRRNGAWLLSDESRQRQIYSTATLASDGNEYVWISAHPGVVRLNVNKKLSTEPFGVAITSISVEGKELNENAASFSPRQNNITIGFSSNSFVDEKAVVYSYRLTRNGKNERWSTASTAHSVNYSSLRPGIYVFEVKALNINGDWSNNTAVYSFRILPPFWQSAWFIAIAILSLGAAIYSLYRYRIKQILRLQEMRNNISRNLHDDIGASLSNINILNELTKRHLNDKEKAKAYLFKSGDDIQHISESLSEIVWNINPRYDDLDNLFIRMKRYAADMMDGKNIRATLDFPGPGVKTGMSMEKRRDFYLIYKEAINNLVKYSKANQALVSIKFSDHTVEMLVSDNGKGFNVSVDGTGNGIQNMKQRADKWKAWLLVKSEAGTGTVVNLKMKL